VTLSKTSARAILGATLTAALIGAVVAAAAPADAANQTTGCSSWVKAPTTRYHLRECAGVVHINGHKMLRVTMYVKNLGAGTRDMTGQYGVSWGQAGTGGGFTDNTVAPGTTMDMTRKVRMTEHATYKATARITVDGHNSPTVHTNVAN
jgi:hypothetical protein